MRLARVRLELFRNIVSPQTLDVEPDVTCLVGKNESGKTSVLEALHRLNPANHRESRFDLTTEYPRWRVVKDGREQELSALCPAVATFRLEEADLEACSNFLPARPPANTECTLRKTYANRSHLSISAPFPDVLAAAIAESDVAADDAERILAAADRAEFLTMSKELAKALKDIGETARSKAVTALDTIIERYRYLLDEPLTQEQLNDLGKLVPKFFYFSDYELLPGESDLTVLGERMGATNLTPEEESVLALLGYASAEPGDFLGDNYDSRKAQLQGAALELSRSVFEYWRQNTDLEVEFDSELEPVADGTGTPTMHRILKILMRDNRHGGIVTNFTTRSAGFRWFFSFLAAFSRYQASPDPVIVLLDEPGTSLHGEAQKDFLRFIFSELGASKQVIYTTHSQYMIDPSQYEKLRGVEDRATRANPNLGVVIQPVDVTADPQTILPVQGALGYSINQHLFIGAGRHLAVEGGSDFIYLDRLSTHLAGTGRIGLDHRLKILPVGGADIIPAFVALLARDLEISVLLDGDRGGRHAQRVLSQVAKGVISEAEVVFVAEVPGVVSKGDVEDLFDPDDYVRLFNWTFGTSLTAGSLPRPGQRIVARLEESFGSYDHALPAYEFSRRVDDFFAAVQPGTLDRFEALIERLNATLVGDSG